MTDWLDFAVVMLSSAGVSVALTAALVWLLRSWIGERVRGAIQAEYAEKLETLKVQLQAEAALKLETYRATLKGQGDAELEKLRASLAIAAAARNAQYGGLVERRFEAIAAVHGLLLRFHQAVHQLVQPNLFVRGPTNEESSEAVYQTSIAFESAYPDKKIFLPKSLSDQIDHIRQSLVSNANLYQMMVVPKQDYERHLEVYVKVSNELPKTIAALEAELRALMGDEPTSAPPVTGAPPVLAPE
ncbi:hypothetical protein E2553_37790 [Paraburkholderia dipogonis]|uniref:DNA recombination protein RmuC n=1 Tax=Paraburkholderia dipogonis TaxID=1211383 RepID=A0A4Y8ML47_9BURK|nr:hypothetical protein [Paraburkholderia dipogonis]TFE38135.1 hypothetical protein E2553_37790 [Paraburkholderia dipogonis]